MIDETVRQFGGIDIVVNSGGVRTNGSITDITRRRLGPHARREFERRVYRFPAGDPRDEKARRWRDSSHCGALGMLGQAGRAAYCASKGGMVR